MNYKMIWAFFAIAAVFGGTAVFSDEEALPIEGIAYESKNPSQSLVSIGGNLYKQGDHYEGYEILEIKSTRIAVKNKEGKLSEYAITGNPERATETAAQNAVTISSPPMKRVPEPSASSPAPEASQGSPPSNMLEQVQGMISKLNLSAITNHAMEVAVLADLRKFYTQANIAMMESEMGRLPSMDEMIQRGIVDRAYQENPNGYRFTAKEGKKGVQVFAEPLRSAEKSRHFMVDDEGRLRVESGRSATTASPLYQALVNVQGLIPQNSQMPEGIEE